MGHLASVGLPLLVGIISLSFVDLRNAPDASSARNRARNVDIFMDGSSDQCGTQVESLSGSIFSHAGRAQYQEERQRHRIEKIERQRAMRENMTRNAARNRTRRLVPQGSTGAGNVGGPGGMGGPGWTTPKPSPTPMSDFDHLWNSLDWGTYPDNQDCTVNFVAPESRYRFRVMVEDDEMELTDSNDCFSLSSSRASNQICGNANQTNNNAQQEATESEADSSANTNVKQGLSGARYYDVDAEDMSATFQTDEGSGSAGYEMYYFAYIPMEEGQEQCTDNDFKCAADNICLPREFTCNNRNECSDGEDEFCSSGPGWLVQILVPCLVAVTSVAIATTVCMCWMKGKLKAATAPAHYPMPGDAGDIPLGTVAVPMGENVQAPGAPPEAAIYDAPS